MRAKLWKRPRRILQLAICLAFSFWLRPRLGLPATPVPSPAAGTRSTFPHGEVTLTVAEYRALLDAAEAQPPSEERDALIESARFHVSMQEETAVFEEDFRAKTHANGWVSAPVVRGGLERSSVSPADRAFFFFAKEVNHLALLGPGSATASLRTTFPSALDRDGHRTFSLPLTLFPLQSGIVELPGKNLEIELTGGEVLSRSESGAKTVLEVTGRPGSTLKVSFRQQNLRERGIVAPLRASTTLYARTEVVGPNLVTDAFIRVTATSGSIPGVELVVPSNARVLFLRGSGLLAPEVSGNRVRASRVSPSPEPLEAQLRMTRPFDENAPVELPVPRPVLTGPIDLYAELRPPQGSLAETIETGSFEVIEAERLPGNLRPLGAEAEEILHTPEGNVDPKPVVYRLHRLEAAAVLTAQVRSVRGRSIVSSTGRTLSRIEYEVLSSAKPFLTLHLPPASSFWGAETMGKPILPAASAKESISIPLRTGRSRIARAVVFLLSPVAMPRGNGIVEFRPPSSDIPIASLEWTLSLPSGAEYHLVGSDYREGSGGRMTPEEEKRDGGSASDLVRKAQEVLGEEARTAGRAPIVPRMPDLPVVTAVRTELPASDLKPIRIEVRTHAHSEPWQ